MTGRSFRRYPETRAYLRERRARVASRTIHGRMCWLRIIVTDRTPSSESEKTTARAYLNYGTDLIFPYRRVCVEAGEWREGSKIARFRFRPEPFNVRNNARPISRFTRFFDERTTSTTYRDRRVIRRVHRPRRRRFSYVYSFVWRSFRPNIRVTLSAGKQTPTSRLNTRHFLTPPLVCRFRVIPHTHRIPVNHRPVRQPDRKTDAIVVQRLETAELMTTTR